MRCSHLEISKHRNMSKLQNFVLRLSKKSNNIRKRSTKRSGPNGSKKREFVNFCLVNVIGHIVEQKVRRNLAFDNRFSILHYAAQCNSLFLARTLLAYGAEVNVVAHGGITPLHFSIFNQSLAMTEWLLECNANINAKTSEGETALHLAAATGQIGIVKLLLNKGADVNATNSWGYSPLHHALTTGHNRIFHLLLKWESDVHLKNFHNLTFLHIAIIVHNETACRELLNYGIDVNAKDTFNMTPLHVAIYCNNLTIIRLLLEAKADVNAAMFDMATPLCIAASAQDLNILAEILKYKPDIDNPHNKRSIYVGIFYGKKQAVDLLLAYGFSLNEEDLQCDFLLAAAVHHNLDVIVEILLKLGADPNHTCFNDVFGQKKLPVVFDAIRNNSVKIVKLLLRFGAHLKYDRAIKKNLWMVCLRRITKKKNLELMRVLVPHIPITLKEMLYLQTFAFSCGSSAIYKEIQKYIVIKMILHKDNQAAKKNEYYPSFHQDCVSELEVMANADLCEGHRLIDILSWSEEKMTRLAQNRSFIQAVSKSSKQYRIYKHILHMKIQRGVQRKRLIDPIAQSMAITIDRKLPIELTRKIASYLTTPELKRLCKLHDIYISHSTTPRLKICTHNKIA